ncbi:protein translocase subunit SecF [Candidatus Parcubacteria bacterium]|nr:MAG: protein translocase subunit SecF [Candidatus Parcubacteria bacterium]
MYIIHNRKIFFVISAILVLASIISIAIFGLKAGTDFTGGTLVQATYSQGRPAGDALTVSLEDAGFEGFSLREANENDYILRAANLTTEQRENIESILSLNGKHSVTIAQLTEVGPTIGTELRNKALAAIALVMTAILLFIAFAFRKVSKPISSWVYGLIALVTLGFDVLVPVGFYAFLGFLTGAQVDTLFVTAALTILGYSVHDTIVVFDRTRENLRINQEKNRKEDFAETAGHALGQTFVRSVTTSLTTALALMMLFLFGPESTSHFSLTLLVGIIVGAYSSIFLATPLLVAYERWRGQKGK